MTKHLFSKLRHYELQVSLKMFNILSVMQIMLKILKIYYRRAREIQVAMHDMESILGKYTYAVITML